MAPPLHAVLTAERCPPGPVTKGARVKAPSCIQPSRSGRWSSSRAASSGSPTPPRAPEKAGSWNGGEYKHESDHHRGIPCCDEAARTLMFEPRLQAVSRQFTSRVLAMPARRNTGGRGAAPPPSRPPPLLALARAAHAARCGPQLKSATPLDEGLLDGADLVADHALGGAAGGGCCC